MAHTDPTHHMHDATFWDDMYRRRDAPWDSEPNPFLPEDIADLTPGTALDLGCGEGSDAVWLAKRGWTVTAVDISKVALDRGRAADVDHLVNWKEADLLKLDLPADTYDLVSTHFLHLLPADRPAFFSNVAQSVRVGGTVLVVTHHISDLQTDIGRPPNPDLFFSAEEVASQLTPGRWEILTAGTRPRVVERHGKTITIHDMVLKARRIV